MVRECRRLFRVHARVALINDRILGAVVGTCGSCAVFVVSREFEGCVTYIILASDGAYPSPRWLTDISVLRGVSLTTSLFPSF